jgi:hypothetical protein
VARRSSSFPSEELLPQISSPRLHTCRGRVTSLNLLSLCSGVQGLEAGGARRDGGKTLSTTRVEQDDFSLTTRRHTIRAHTHWLSHAPGLKAQLSISTRLRHGTEALLCSRQGVCEAEIADDAAAAWARAERHSCHPRSPPVVLPAMKGDESVQGGAGQWARGTLSRIMCRRLALRTNAAGQRQSPAGFVRSEVDYPIKVGHKRRWAPGGTSGDATTPTCSAHARLRTSPSYGILLDM